MTLDIEIKARNLSVNDRLENYVISKTAKLERYMNGLNEATVELTHAKTARNSADRYIAQITVRGKGLMLRAEERTDDIYASVDNALDKLQRQIARYKGKHYRGRGDGTSMADVAIDMVDDVEDEDSDEMTIVRRKKFTLIPMDEMDAIEQSNLLDHQDFFVFYNVNTNSVNVLYHRRDGSYGLIETEIG